MKDLVKKLKKLLKNDIIDLIIFGSYSKKSIKPKDIDIAVISKEKTIKKDIQELIEKTISKPADVQIVTIEKYDNFLWISLIREGFSVKHNKYLSEIYGIHPVVLYKYSLKELTPSKKVMFERAIKNFQEVKKLSNRVILVPYNQSGEFEDFLKNWELDIDTMEYGLLPLVRQETP